ncbi:membrane dipeptidase [Parafrigoribacterium mesophilum]|uniref:dipeptidase n=1 Tax=Parafrigoribacterium mesophilum TaxID=433646 RepID=UPI0031FD221E
MSAERGLPHRRIVFDSHAHGTQLLPRPVAALNRLLRPGQPRDTGFGTLRTTEVDGIVVSAVGDKLVTQFRWPASAWRAVLDQFAMIRREAKAGGCALVATSAEIMLAMEHRRTAVVLGLEGADTLAGDLRRLNVLHDLGVRVVGVMHFSDNPFGTICMGFTGATSGTEVAAGRKRGLTELGGELVDNLNAKDMLIDVSHADEETVLGMCERSSRPVISSHTGARALDDFPRYLSDRAMVAIAATGGVVGLWPYRGQGHGMETFDHFASHARHIASLVGVAHVAIGTDMNGVPGLTKGYEGPQHISRLVDALEHGGFSDADIDAIMGGNVMRLLTRHDRR